MKSDNDVVHYETTPIKGGFMGECAEFPSVIVYAKTEAKVKEKMVTALTGYIKAFPDQANTAKEEKIKHIPRNLLING